MRYIISLLSNQVNINLKAAPKNLFAGLIIGIISAISSIAYAALIFHDDLSQYLAIGAGACLLGSLVLTLALGAFSSSKRAIGQAQDVFAAIAAVVCYDVASKVLEINTIDVLPSVIATLLIIAISSGLSMFLLGQLHLGKLIRYFPYPVIGGFLAGTGWLIFCQCFLFLTSSALSYNNLAHLLSPQIINHWLIPLAYALLMIWMIRRSNHYLTLPLLLIGSVLIFYLYLLYSGFSLDDAMTQGWMMGPFPKGTLASIPSLNLLHGTVHWNIVLNHIPDYLTLITLAAISLLLNVSSFEIMSDETMDINKELKVTGIANILSGLLGGLGGYQGIALSRINLKLKLSTRLVSIICGLFLMLIIIIGTSCLQYLPKYAFGALLLFVALDFMQEWLIDIKKKISWPDYFVVLTIAVCIGLKGFLVGLLVGLILSLVLFIIHYSSIEIIRTIITGDLIRSTVERNEVEKSILSKKANDILIPVISGYLFFGNTAFVMSKIIDGLTQERYKKIKYICLDFSRVTGMEVSSFMSVVKLLQFGKNHDMHIVFANLPSDIKREIKRFVKGTCETLIYHDFHDLDHAIEWCENAIIAGVAQPTIPAAHQFQFLSASQEENALLKKYFTHIEVPEGQVLYRQGEAAHDLIYLGKGKLSVFLEYETKNQVRLTQIKEGAIVGEMGLFLQEPRSATVVATEPSIIYTLSDTNLNKLYLEQPALGIALDKLIIKFLGRRIKQANNFNSFIKMSL